MRVEDRSESLANRTGFLVRGPSWGDAEFYGTWLLAASRAEKFWREAREDPAFLSQTSRPPTSTISAIFSYGRLNAQVVGHIQACLSYWCGQAWARSVGQIEFEMPLTIDSFEQGVALISHAVGKEFDPLVHTPWLSDGRKWQDHLPWLRGRARHNKDRS
jgi:hypothetical protein